MEEPLWMVGEKTVMFEALSQFVKIFGTCYYYYYQMSAEYIEPLVPLLLLSSSYMNINCTPCCDKYHSHHILRPLARPDCIYILLFFF